MLTTKQCIDRFIESDEFRLISEKLKISDSQEKMIRWYLAHRISSLRQSGYSEPIDIGIESENEKIVIKVALIPATLDSIRFLLSPPTGDNGKS